MIGHTGVDMDIDNYWKVGDAKVYWRSPLFQSKFHFVANVGLAPIEKFR
jgi:hypothetical protein